LSVTLFFGATSGIFYYYINKINKSYSEIINVRVNILSNVKDIEILATQQTNSLRGYLLTKSPDFEKELQRANIELDLLIHETSSLVTQNESRKVVTELSELNKQFTKKYEELLRQFEEDSNQEEALEYFISEVLPIGVEFAPLTKYLTDRNKQLMSDARAENTALVDDIKQTTILISIVVLIINLLIGLFISKNITNNLSKITKVITTLTSTSSTRERYIPIEVKTKDEIGDIANAFNKMTKALQEKSWLETSITEIATMYQGIHDLSTLAEKFITKITPMVGANYGVFYIKQGSEEPRFHSLATYAFQNQKMSVPSFSFGEGIIGQAALEKRAIHLVELPENYIQISSGLGAASPASLFIIPVEFEGEITVIIELASFKKFEPIHETLLKQIANHIGITVNSVSGRMQVENLLRESKQLTEELQSQSEELQLQHEELISMNEKLEEQYKSSEQKTIDLNNTKMELEEKAVQLELNSKYKSEFLANMSHELRSPLNSLLILAHLLTENEEGNLTNQQVEFADTIYKSGNDLLHLINEILDLSKIESGNIEIIPSEVNLNDVCRFIERQFQPLADQKGLNFSIQIDDKLPRVIWTDEQRLQQVIKNLLTNAFKFTEHGKVEMKLYKANLANHPTLKNDETIIAFSIKDTGIGIPIDKQQLIFKAFQQGDGTTSRKYGGTGLGLSISREIAQLLGGGIDVESSPSKGSTFTFYLPVYEKSSLSEVTPLKDEVATALEIINDNKQKSLVEQDGDELLKGKKILIVDDDMRNIFAITTALEKKQMKIVFAENGKSGLVVLQENPDIDLILMDIMMPEMDGYETIQIIRKKLEYEDIPIIALTAKAMKIDKDKCIEAGASDYISKPVFLDQLFSLMKVWLYR
jgi:two-component system chemotaxis sensor kinase CheA